MTSPAVDTVIAMILDEGEIKVKRVGKKIEVKSQGEAVLLTGAEAIEVAGKFDEESHKPGANMDDLSEFRQKLGHEIIKLQSDFDLS